MIRDFRFWYYYCCMIRATTSLCCAAFHCTPSHLPSHPPLITTPRTFNCCIYDTTVMIAIGLGFRLRVRLIFSFFIFLPSFLPSFLFYVFCFPVSSPCLAQQNQRRQRQEPKTSAGQHPGVCQEGTASPRRYGFAMKVRLCQECWALPRRYGFAKKVTALPRRCDIRTWRHEIKLPPTGRHAQQCVMCTRFFRETAVKTSPRLIYRLPYCCSSVYRF